MQFVESWASGDQKVLLSFTIDVLDTFSRHMQDAPNAPESGGLLLGSLHGNNLIITEATVPTKWDRRFRFLFERMPFGHRSIAERRWRESDGTIRYLGEWHTHPQDIPTPSSLDREEWGKLTQCRADGRPLLAVIVGRKSLHVELVGSNGYGTLLGSIA